MKVERNRVGNKYTFTPEDRKDEKFLDKIAQLEEENKKLKEEVKKWKMIADENGTHYDMLEEENKEMKEEGDMAITHNLLLIEENKRLRKGIDIRLDSMGVKYIITEKGDYFAKSDFKITELID